MKFTLLGITLVVLLAVASCRDWEEIGGRATQISATANGEPLVVNRGRNIYARTWRNSSRGLRARDIGAGGNRVWAIARNQRIYYKNGNSWRRVGGAAVRICVDNKGEPWVVNRGRRIYNYSMRTRRWRRIPGAAYDIGCGGGRVWVIGANREAGGFGIYRLNGNQRSWTKIPGSALRISVDSKGNAWVTNRGRYIYRYTGSKWHRIRSGRALDVSIGEDGSAWVIGTNYRVYKFISSHNTWRKVNGPGSNIAVDSKGQPWTVTRSGVILSRTWRNIPGKALDIGAFTQVMVVGSNGRPYILAGGRHWRMLPGSSIRRMCLDNKNNPWVVTSNRSIYTMNLRTKRWTRIRGAAYDIGCGGGKVWVIGTNREGGGYGIYRYDSLCSKWQKIPGSAVRIDVGPDGNAWVVNKGHYIYKYTGTNWSRTSGRALDITVADDGSTWVIGTNQGIFANTASRSNEDAV